CRVKSVVRTASSQSDHLGRNVAADFPFMNQTDVVLAEECRVFTWYLLRLQPSDYVIDKYRAAHAVTDAYTTGGFDVWLVRVAARAPWCTALADGFATVCDRRGLLRRKLVLLLAILETSSPAHRALEAAQRGALNTVLSVSGHVMLSASKITLGVLIF